MKLKFKKSDEYRGLSLFFLIFTTISGLIVFSTLYSFNPNDWNIIHGFVLLTPTLFMIGGIVGFVRASKAYFRNQGLVTEIQPDGIYVTKYQEWIETIPWNDIQRIEYFSVIRHDSYTKRRVNKTISVHLIGGPVVDYKLNLIDSSGQSVLKITVTCFETLMDYLKLFYQYHPLLMRRVHTPDLCNAYRFEDVRVNIRTFEKESFHHRETLLNGESIESDEECNWTIH